MSDSDKLRDRATRLFALALKARDHGFSGADALADLASEALAQAEDMEHRAATQQAQQQQQHQPDKKE